MVSITSLVVLRYASQQGQRPRLLLSGCRNQSSYTTGVSKDCKSPADKKMFQDDFNLKQCEGVAGYKDITIKKWMLGDLE